MFWQLQNPNEIYIFKSEVTLSRKVEVPQGLPSMTEEVINIEIM